MNLNFKIKTLVLICLIFLGVFSQYYSQTSNKEGFKTGADQPEKYLSLLTNKKVAVVTNQTGLVTRVKYYNAAKNPLTGCSKAMKIDNLSIVDFFV